MQKKIDQMKLWSGITLLGIGAISALLLGGDLFVKGPNLSTIWFLITNIVTATIGGVLLADAYGLIG